MVDCVWATGGDKPNNQKFEIRNLKSPVSLADHFDIRSGLLEITYNTGAKVILQGPVTYDVESADGGYLAIGKLTARLGEREERRGESATPQAVNLKSEIIHHESTASSGRHPLFTVKTPTAIVTDLGTEFGVEVDKRGDTVSYVFRGSVTVQPADDGKNAKAAVRVLHARESARIAHSGDEGRGELQVTAVPDSVLSSDFVRKIDKLVGKTLDLADVVAGGNGFSSRRKAGIDATNGEVVHALPKTDAAYFMTGDGRFHRVRSMPFIDGVFIPGPKPIQVDSAGHMFSDWSVSGPQTVGYVWASGPGGSQQFCPKLSGVDYASAEHGVLVMHANKGLTFDLDAIRHANPGYKIQRFTAMAGNAEALTQQEHPVYADFWVLVDGIMRFRRCQINGTHGAFSVAVPLQEKDRFLTLAATDGANGSDGDWIVFGDPRLELARGVPSP